MKVSENVAIRMREVLSLSREVWEDLAGWADSDEAARWWWANVQAIEIREDYTQRDLAEALMHGIDPLPEGVEGIAQEIEDLAEGLDEKEAWGLVEYHLGDLAEFYSEPWCGGTTDRSKGGSHEHEVEEL